MQTLLDVLRTVERRAEAVVPIFLDSIAVGATERSPVDTGAYVTSFSFTTTSGAGRMRTAEGKPGKQNREQKQAEGLAQLRSDIAAIPPTMPNIYFTNRAPHARYVENREGIFALVRSMASTLLEDAVQEASLIR